MKLIDAHMHFDEEHIEQVLQTMRVCGIDYVVNLSMPQNPEEFMSMLTKSLKLGKGRIATLSHFLFDSGNNFRKKYSMSRRPLTSFDEIDKLGVVDGLVGRLRNEVAAGSKGLKVLKELGLDAKDSKGNYIKIDDERLRPLWDTCAELGVPVLNHTADPHPAFRLESEGNKYYWGGEEFFSIDELMEQRENLIRWHPDTVFVNAHCGYPYNLDHLAELFDKYPNYCADMEGPQIKLTPVGKKYTKHRDLLIKYADRFCYGVDIFLLPGQVCDDEWSQEIYHKHLKWLSTSEDGGINLPEDVVQKILYENPKRIYNLSEII